MKQCFIWTYAPKSNDVWKCIVTCILETSSWKILKLDYTTLTQMSKYYAYPVAQWDSLVSKAFVKSTKSQGTICSRCDIDITQSFRHPHHLTHTPMEFISTFSIFMSFVYKYIFFSPQVQASRGIFWEEELSFSPGEGMSGWYSLWTWGTGPSKDLNGRTYQ